MTNHQSAADVIAEKQGAGSLRFRPELVDPSAWIASTAILRGEVQVGALASIWFGTVIRGDAAPIHIGEGSNVQYNILGTTINRQGFYSKPILCYCR